MDKFLIAKATDVGVARQVNEDSMTVFESPNGQVLAVCDGMGGQAAGDVASQLAVSIIESILTDNVFDDPDDAIRRSIMAANQGVLNRTAQNPELEGMGSTCAMLIIKNGRVHCGWVGDSRIYYISNHTIRQISHDQSYVQQLVDSGQITKAEAVNHPQKNEITNCIGLQGMAEPETVVPIMPEPGSVFLLCSDGLSSMVDEARIERVISSSDMSLQQKADRLIEMANNAGGLDNITIELVQFSTSNNVGATSGTLFDTAVDTRAKKSPIKALLYGLIGAVVVAGLGFGAYKLLDKKPKPEQPVKTEAPKPDVPSGDQNVNVSTNTGGQSTTPAPSTTVSTKSTSTTGSSTGTSVSSSSSSKANAKTAIKNESKTNSNNAKKNQIKNAADGKTDEKTNQKQKVVIDEAKKGQTPPAGDLPEGTLREKD